MSSTTPFYKESAERFADTFASRKPSYPPPAPIHVPRVTQLDAGLLDAELEAILREPLSASLQTLKPPGRRSLEPELIACLRFILLRLSLNQSSSSYGSKMQNLRFRDERPHLTPLDGSLTPNEKHLHTPFLPRPSKSQMNAYVILSVLPEYLHSRLREHMLSKGWGDYPRPFTIMGLLPFSRDPRRKTARKREWKRIAWDAVNICENIFTTAKLLNLLLFLYDGKFRSLLDRLLGLRLVHANQSIFRNVTYEFLNRQLVWEVFTEFLLFFLPLINLRKSRLWVKRKIKRVIEASDESPSSATTNSDINKQGPLFDLSYVTCAICYADSLTINRSAMETDPDPTDPVVAASASRAYMSRGSGDDGAPDGCELKIPYSVDCCNAKYCYYCVASRMRTSQEEEGTNWQCLRCGQEITSISRWNGEFALRGGEAT